MTWGNATWTFLLGVGVHLIAFMRWWGFEAPRENPHRGWDIRPIGVRWRKGNKLDLIWILTMCWKIMHGRDGARTWILWLLVWMRGAKKEAEGWIPPKWVELMCMGWGISTLADVGELGSEMSPGACPDTDESPRVCIVGLVEPEILVTVAPAWRRGVKHRP